MAAATVKGYGEDQLAEIAKIIDAKHSDLFDVLAYIAFALAPITRAERVEAHRETILARYDEKLRGFLDFVLFQYVGQGVGELEPEKLPALIELKYHSVADAAAELGGIQAIRGAFLEFQRHLYEHRR